MVSGSATTLPSSRTRNATLSPSHKPSSSRTAFGIGSENRNYTTIVNQTAGVAPLGGWANVPQPRVLGSTIGENAYFIDGMDATNPVMGTATTVLNFDVSELSTKHQVISATLGGPILRDKLWFFASCERIQDLDTPGGTLTTREHYGQNYLGKITWQIDPSWRLSTKNWRCDIGGWSRKDGIGGSFEHGAVHARVAAGCDRPKPIDSVMAMR